ncbi:MAG: DUF2149 domain-containing protein [Solirubrobacterales bacterium]|nr:DUF2149 domain-containing protein [Solirubrobacterales bacterium]
MLAVAFLLAALQSVNLTDLLTKTNVTVLRTDASGQTIIVKEGDQVKTVARHCGILAVGFLAMRD